ncbi:leukocyte elastase inhibitor-like [Montipora foliosa]|uniref:leukocyte elastase inhibitor-like n=1 Tax=Montipora foliosa TaxID=591990 RepID=UPI0035F182D8
MESAVQASNKFCVDLHKHLQSDDKFQGKNLFYSSSSLSVALAMIYMGARGKTAAQLNKALHWEGLPQDKLHSEEKVFLAVLQESNAKGNELQAANRLFVQKDFNLVQDFVKGTKEFYGAKIALVDYKKDAEGARREVNKWVEEQTKKKIENLIAEGVFNNLTRLTLVNAIYFKGFWQNQFKKRATYNQEFFPSESEKMKVKMMHLTAMFKHVYDEGKLSCQVLEMPYQGNELSMIVLLPHEIQGLAKLEEELTNDKLDEVIESLSKVYPEKVEVSLPRFKFTQEFHLNDILSKMGATDMFSEFDADFTGITAAHEKLCVSDVIHKAFVEVNEKGTEAAAVTAGATVVKSRSARVVEPPVFRADHPFLFLIHHKKSRAILFMGRLIKPEVV